MTRPRVLVVTRSAEIWGAEESLLAIIGKSRSLIDYEVVLERGSPLIGRLVDLQVPYIEWDFSSQLGKRTGASLAAGGPIGLVREAFRALRGGWRLRHSVRGHDIILSFSLWQAFEARIAAGLARKKFVLDLHETFSSQLGTRLASWVARSATLTIAPSRHVIDRTIRGGSTRVQVIPRPVDVPGDLATPAEHAVDRPVVVGMFGQISAHKRVELAVHATIDCDVALTLMIVGGRGDLARDAYEDSVRAIATRHYDRIHIVDRTATPLRLMTECDYVLNLSEHEAFGRTVLESTLVGAVPIVLTGSGPEEIVDLTGIGIKLDSPADLGSTLASLVPIGRTPDETLTRLRDRFSSESIGATYASALLSVA